MPHSLTALAPLARIGIRNSTLARGRVSDLSVIRLGSRILGNDPAVSTRASNRLSQLEFDVTGEDKPFRIGLHLP